jgi:hypothetical protein
MLMALICECAKLINLFLGANICTAGSWVGKFVLQKLKPEHVVYGDPAQKRPIMQMACYGQKVAKVVECTHLIWCC